MKHRTVLTILLALGFAAGWLFYEEAFGQEITGEGTVTLSWTPPTEYENGDPIQPGDITGYVIYYGTESRELVDGNFRQGCADGPQVTRTDATCYPNVIDLSDGSLTSLPVTITVSETTTFHFAAVAFVGTGSLDGREVSRYSNEALKTVELVIDTTQPGPPTITTIDFVISCSTDLPNVTCEFSVTP